MYIKEVTGQNIKGSTFNRELFPATLIVGPNYKGKSTITDAVRLALLRKLPELPATNELRGERATFQIASGPYMTAGIVMDTGENTHSNWSSKGSSVSLTVENNLPEEVENSLGVMLNIKEFFSLPQAKRVNYLFSVIPLGSEFTPKKLIAKLKNIRPSESNEYTEEAISTLIDKITSCSDDTVSIQEFYETSVELVKDLKKQSDAAVKSMTAGASAISQLVAMEEQVNAYDPVNLASRRSGFLDQENGLSSERGGLIRAREQRVKTAKLISDAQAVVDQYKDFSTSEIEAVTKARDIDTHSLSAKEQTLEKVRSELSKLTTELSSKDTLRRERAADMDSANESVESFDKHTACPTCGAKSKGWKATVLKTLNEAADKAKDAYDQAKADHDAIKELFSKKNTEYTQTRDEIMHLRVNLQALQNKVTELDRICLRVSSAKATLSSLGSKEDSDKETDRINEIDNEITSLRQQRSEIDGQIAKATSIQNDIKRLAQTKKEREIAEAESVVYKEALVILSGDKEALVHTAIQTILKPINFFAKGILEFEVEFKNNEFGYTHPKGKHWVSSRTFSGAEELIACMAISLALASISKFKLAIIDELRRLEDGTLAAFLGRVREAIDIGFIHQFIGILPVKQVDPAYAKGYEVITIS